MEPAGSNGSNDARGCLFTPLWAKVGFLGSITQKIKPPPRRRGAWPEHLESSWQSSLFAHFLPRRGAAHGGKGRGNLLTDLLAGSWSCQSGKWGRKIWKTNFCPKWSNRRTEGADGTSGARWFQRHPRLPVYSSLGKSSFSKDLLLGSGAQKGCLAVLFYPRLNE